VGHRRPEIAPQLKAWWKGVRTWRLPGEVISPHDRLDLWHPQNLSLGEKMRSFPFPLATSPPSAVPEPAERLLEKILATLRLDPAVADPRDFAASMRALAILCLSVNSFAHSRTRSLALQSILPAPCPIRSRQTKRGLTKRTPTSISHFSRSCSPRPYPRHRSRWHSGTPISALWRIRRLRPRP
jgi:hypothetical protein